MAGEYFYEDKMISSPKKTQNPLIEIQRFFY